MYHLTVINALNLSFCGKCNLAVGGRNSGFLKESKMLWREHFENGSWEMFLSLCDFFEESSLKESLTETFIFHT